jgi:hypothetical protein
MDHIYENPNFGENWFTYPNLYSEMVSRFGDGSKFVEVGSWKGKSSAYMAVEIINSGKKIDFYCVDTWLGSVEHLLDDYKDGINNLYDIFLENMKPLENFYNPIRTYSKNAANLFRDKSLDFVFIDASHEYEDVRDDILSWLPKVKEGGVIAGHDYYPYDYNYFQGVKKAVNEILGGQELKYSESCWIYYL